MLQAFEHWFATLFYEDELQTRGSTLPRHGAMKRSRTAICTATGTLAWTSRKPAGALKWDFIIVHESRHEWFANNITYRIADMWVHEEVLPITAKDFTRIPLPERTRDAYIRGCQSLIHTGPIVQVYYNIRDSRAPSVCITKAATCCTHHPPDRGRRRKMALNTAQAEP